MAIRSIGGYQRYFTNHVNDLLEQKMAAWNRHTTTIFVNIQRSGLSLSLMERVSTDIHDDLLVHFLSLLCCLRGASFFLFFVGPLDNWGSEDCCCKYQVALCKSKWPPGGHPVVSHTLRTLPKELELNWNWKRRSSHQTHHVAAITTRFGRGLAVGWLTGQKLWNCPWNCRKLSLTLLPAGSMTSSPGCDVVVETL